jgi:hypothetical protein
LIKDTYELDSLSDGWAQGEQTIGKGGGRKIIVIWKIRYDIQNGFEEPGRRGNGGKM